MVAKLKVAKKRDETSLLIDEVFAQKDALEKRISALQDGLRISTDLVDTSSSDPPISNIVRFSNNLPKDVSSLTLFR